MSGKYVHLTPRLSCALSMLSGAETIADIGCDHGRLTAALLQKSVCRQVIATDISEPSLLKAKQLLTYIGFADRVSFRLGDGLNVIKPYECDAIAMLGIGGTLMQQILERDTLKLKGASFAVMQPMRAQADIRSYLYRNNYHITEDRIVCEHSRFYQVFKAVPGTEKQPWPEDFPYLFFDVGFQSFVDRDPNLAALCRYQLLQYEKCVSTASGSDGEAKLQTSISALKQILWKLQEEKL